ncbi:MoaD/ThiS family protein [Roseateles violae]|uniref:Molybdopterin synthase sulfur carrier subunit n=1 Tax=Roseateles violae TaxID=3058042 RepID=A0ABT8DSE0_9BURK|nr:MoaD/ThiS family protein [Pelomonas sp. PFR6]MDN3919950.1 MoaD/ThiS family protein [Pelomonas sp. PFR6]
MRITLRYFASLREALGPGESLEVEEGLSVGALRERLIARGGAHAERLARGRALRCALNKQMCGEDAQLAAGDELAFFPPVTGG